MSLFGEDNWWHHAAKAEKTSTLWGTKFHLHENREATLCGISLTIALECDFGGMLFLEHVPEFHSIPAAMAHALPYGMKCQECDYEFTGRRTWSREVRVCPRCQCEHTTVTCDSCATPLRGPDGWEPRGE